MTVAAIDRAFALARSGEYRSVSEVIRRMPAQDRPAIEAHLMQPGARRELILICSAAWLARE
jgi:Arc/MetJ-type ribon-helix-helix transcriptional regulator